MFSGTTVRKAGTIAIEDGGATGTWTVCSGPSVTVLSTRLRLSWTCGRSTTGGRSRRLMSPQRRKRGLSWRSYNARQSRE